MGCARRGELNIKVDHKDGSISFVDDAFAISSEDPYRLSPTASSSKTQLREKTIQPSLAETVHTRLSKMATSLHNSLLILEQAPAPTPTQDEQFAQLVVAVEKERKALQVKRALVARRRELVSELTVRKEKEESSRRAEISRREKEEEQRRLREEQRKRELERMNKQIEIVRIDEAKKYAQSLVDKGILKAKEVDVSVFRLLLFLSLFRFAIAGLLTAHALRFTHFPLRMIETRYLRHRKPHRDASCPT